MTYFQNLNRLILKELELRAEQFASAYEKDKPSVILVPGGMGSRLMQCEAPFQPDDFPNNPAFKEIWLSWPAIVLGRIDQLGLDPDEFDHDEKPIIASGEINSIVKSYNGTEAYFIGEGFNYTEFGYDWRRDLSTAAAYLRTFLGMIKTKAMQKTDNEHNPLAGLTLFAHSMGGLVVKLLINELIADNQDPKQWFKRFVSVATPFYGTETHIYRYYRGERLVNLLVGSIDTVARMVATMPGPYGLLPCPREVLDPVLDQLKLVRYPVRDADQDGTPVDPFGPEGQGRFPLYTDRTYFARAKDMFSAVGKVLPAGIYQQIFHIRNNIRNASHPLEWHWRPIDRDNFQPGNDSPIRANNGAGDGTVPFWSARLAHTPDHHIHSLSIDTEHGSLAEDTRVMSIVRDLASDSPIPSAPAGPPSGEGLLPPLSAAGDPDDITALIKEINTGRADEDQLKNLPEPTRRALVRALTLC